MNKKNVDEKYGYETDKYSKFSGYAIIVRNKKINRFIIKNMF